MTLVNSSADVLHKTSNLAISSCCFADDAKEMTKVNKARAGRAKLLFLPSKYKYANLMLTIKNACL